MLIFELYCLNTLVLVGYTRKGNVIAFRKRCLFFFLKAKFEKNTNTTYVVHGGNKKQRKGNLLVSSLRRTI